MRKISTGLNVLAAAIALSTFGACAALNPSTTAPSLSPGYRLQRTKPSFDANGRGTLLCLGSGSAQDASTCASISGQQTPAAEVDGEMHLWFACYRNPKDRNQNSITLVAGSPDNIAKFTIEGRQVAGPLLMFPIPRGKLGECVASLVDDDSAARLTAAIN